MPHLLINGCNYYYEQHGPADAAETIVFSHGLLWSGKLFHYQVAHFAKTYRVVTYDHRGQGQSSVTETGYGMDSLYEDAIALLGALQLGPVHFVGLSMGGFVGMRLAARRPELLRSLILLETSAQPEPNKVKYSLLKFIMSIFGIRSVTKPVMNIMFGDTFLKDPARAAERAEWVTELQKNKKSITKAVDGVIQRQGIERELKNISCPTLVLAGREDKATVPAKAEFIQQHIHGATLQYIARGGHSSSIEEPVQVNAYIEAFLAGLAR